MFASDAALHDEVSRDLNGEQEIDPFQEIFAASGRSQRSRRSRRYADDDSEEEDESDDGGDDSESDGEMVHVRRQPARSRAASAPARPRDPDQPAVRGNIVVGPGQINGDCDDEDVVIPVPVFERTVYGEERYPECVGSAYCFMCDAHLTPTNEAHKALRADIMQLVMSCLDRDIKHICQIVQDYYHKNLREKATRGGLSGEMWPVERVFHHLFMHGRTTATGAKYDDAVSGAMYERLIASACFAKARGSSHAEPVIKAMSMTKGLMEYRSKSLKRMRDARDEEAAEAKRAHDSTINNRATKKPRLRGPPRASEVFA